MHDKLNYTYMDMKRDNYAYPVAKMNVKYIKPATLGDILLLKLDLISLEPSMDIKYFIYNKESGEKIFEASTMQIAINTETMQSVYTPPIGLTEAVRKAAYEKV